MKIDPVVESEKIRKRMNDAAIEKWGHIMYPKFTGKPSFYYDMAKWLNEKEENKND